MFEQYKKQVEQEVKRFRGAVNTIRTSENPYYADNVKVQDYEISKLRGELEKKIAEINTKFASEIEPKITEFEEKAATSFFKPSEAERKLVDEAITEFKTDVSLAYSDRDRLDAFDRFEQRINYLDVNGLYEVKKRLPEVAEKIGDQDSALTSKLKGMNAIFKELQTPEQAQLDELKDAKFSGVDASFRRLRLTHPSYSDYKFNRYSK